MRLRIDYITLPLIKYPHLRHIVSHGFRQIATRPQTANPVRPLGCAFQRVATRRRHKIVAPASGMRIDIKKSLFLALHRTHQAHQRRMLQHIGEITRVIMMTVIQATGTLTTVLRTGNEQALIANEGMCASIGKKTAASPAFTRNTEPASNAS